MKGITPYFVAKNRLLKFGFRKTNKILDLGCGEGINISILGELGINNIMGVDASGKQLKIAKRNLPHVKFILASANKLPFKNGEFNVVLVDSVFHHLISYERCIKEINRVLCKRGKLNFIEPTDSILRNFVDFLTSLRISNYLPIAREREVSIRRKIYKKVVEV